MTASVATNHTTPLSPAQRRRQRKLDAILDAAETLVVVVGLDGLTMAKLAAEVDITAGALYRYFASKERMFVQLQVRALAEIDARLNARLQNLQNLAKNTDHSPCVLALAKLVAANDVHARYAEEKTARFALLAMGLSEQRDLVADGGSADVWAGVARLLADVSLLMDDAVEFGAIAPGDSHARAVQLMMGGQGMLQLQKMARHVPDLPSPRSLAAGLCETLLAGWGAPVEDLAAAVALGRMVGPAKLPAPMQTAS